MENLKEIRWKQRYENFDKSYKLLDKGYISIGFFQILNK